MSNDRGLAFVVFKLRHRAAIYITFLSMVIFCPVCVVVTVSVDDAIGLADRDLTRMLVEVGGGLT